MEGQVITPPSVTVTLGGQNSVKDFFGYHSHFTNSVGRDVYYAVIAHQTGKAAFDAVGPLLLIGWAEVGPGLLQAISRVEGASPVGFVGAAGGMLNSTGVDPLFPQPDGDGDQLGQLGSGEDVLLERARRQDAWHRQAYQRPISAETLRKRLHVGAARSRMLVAVLRSTSTDRLTSKESPASQWPG